LPDQSMEEMKAEFVADASESVERLSQRLAGLDLSRSHLGGVVDEVFRAAHSLKGTAGMFGFDEVSKLAGSLENLLEAVRAGKIKLDGRSVGLSVEVLDGLLLLLRDGGQSGGAGSRLIVSRIEAIIAEQRAEEPAEAEAPAEAGADEPAAERAVLSVKVDIGLLDSIMNTVSELFSTKLALSAIAMRLPHTSGTRKIRDDLLKTGMLLGARLEDLETRVAEARLVPVAVLFERYRGEVRRLARQMGKDVTLVCEGMSTRIDRALLERLYDILIHIIRNAVDHGIEPADERRLRNKPAVGRVCLRASEEASHVRIDVEDDGRGIDMDLVRAAATEKGLEVGTKESAIDLLFRPGFTTRRESGEVSGRGVGLDAVRSEVDAMRGVVSVNTEPGSGTRFSIWVPLTLAVSRAMLVEESGVPVVLPLSCVNEVLRLDAKATSEIARSGAIEYRGGLVAASRLAEMLAIKRPASARSIVILGIGGRQRALVVERVGGEVEIVSRPLPHAIGAPAYVAGATELHDGRPALIIQPEEILRGGAELTVRCDRGARARWAEGTAEPNGSGVTWWRDQDMKVLVFRNGVGVYALPLEVLAEILPPGRVTRLPVLGEVWEGVFFVRGMCYGLLATPGVQSQSSAGRPKVVTLRLPERCGVWAEDVLGETAVLAAGLETVPGVGDPGRWAIYGSFTWRGRRVSLLDPGGLLNKGLEAGVLPQVVPEAAGGPVVGAAAAKVDRRE
jgi:two-component system chemotaxis sensor kinase CheA